MIKTFPAWNEEQIAAGADEYGITMAAYRRDGPSDDVRAREWMETARKELIAGEVPDQRWVTDTRRRFPEWWHRRVLHDRPDVADRLFRAGLVCTEAQARASIRGNVAG